MFKFVCINIWLLVATANLLSAQNVIWTGNAGNNDFFDEQNWENKSTGIAPENGTIDPGSEIQYHLELTGTNTNVNALGTIKLGTGSLSILNARLNASAIDGGRITINKDAYIELSEASPLLNNPQIAFQSPIAWLKLFTVSPGTVLSNFNSLFRINETPAQFPKNIRYDNYYTKGTIVRSETESAQPLTVFSEIMFGGTSHLLEMNIIHTGNLMPGNLNNTISSFVLKKGYMATFAVNNDGTGLSKVYIASEEDLRIDKLPESLNNQISFVRVVPWNWVSKKGIGGNGTGLDETWHYAWNNSGNSTIDREYAPMSWGKGGADDDSDIEIYRNKYKATHVLAFNESDNCNDQSGKWGNLCQTDVAVATYKNLMKTGLRLVSPSCRENAPFGWLKEFYDKAVTQEIRIDVIGVHWYDWGSNPANSPNADPEKVFNRFKNYLQKVYDLYKLPIWITEFNANPNRTNSVNLEFMKLALPYLEELECVERYAWFQPNSGVADYFNTQGNYTNVGTFYKTFASTPALKEATLITPNNLDEKLISGISDFSISAEKKKIHIYPNPINETLHLTSTNDALEILIFNAHGIPVLKTHFRPEINVSKLQPGIYFLKTGKQVLKFIKT